MFLSSLGIKSDLLSTIITALLFFFIRFKIYYGSQTKTNPPEFIIFSNFAKNLPNPFRKFFERSIRKEYGFDGISFKLSFRTTRKE